MRADRLLRIVQLLRRHGRLSSADLARRLDVARRTVLRDMDALSAAGVPVYAEHGRDGGFALVPGYAPDVEQLTGEESMALFIAGGRGAADALGLGASYGRALQKLAAGLRDDEHRQVAHVQDRIVLSAGGWLRDPDEPQLLTQVQQAVLADDRIRMRYQSKSATAPGDRTVDPWGLLQVGTTWYLVAAHRGAPRSYRVSRISAVTRLGVPSRRPPDLDLLQVWREMRDGFRRTSATEIVLRIHPPRRVLVLQALAMTALSAPEPVDGDPAALSLRVNSLRGTAAALVGFAEEVEVVEPAALRERIVEIAERASAHHRGRRR